MSSFQRDGDEDMEGLEEVDGLDEAEPADDESTVWGTEVGDGEVLGEGVGGGEEEGEEMVVEEMAHAIFTGHSDCVYCVAIHPLQAGVVLTGGGDDKAYLWKYEANGEISSLKELGGHTDTVTSVGFNFDGTLCLVGSYDGTVSIWHVASGEKHIVLEGPEDVEWAEWHSKGNAVAAGSKDGTVWMWLAHNGQCVQVFAGHDGPVTSGLFTSDGKTVCSGGEDGTVRVWAPKTGACKHTFEGGIGHEAPVTCIANSAQDADLLLTGSIDGTLRLFQISGKRLLQKFVHSSAKIASSSSSASAAAAAAAAGGGDEEDEEEGREEEEAEALSVECCGFSHGDLKWVASGGMDKELKVWDTASGTLRSTCTHGGSVVSLRWHETLPVICTAALDCLIRVWDARNGHLLASLSGHREQITFLAFLPLPPAAAASGAATGGATDEQAKQTSEAVQASSSSLDVIVTASDDFTSRVFHIDTRALLA